MLHVNHSEQIILVGAGATGRFVVRDMIAVGAPPVAIADNDPKKQGTEFEGIKILSPEECKHAYPDAEWIASVMHEKHEPEILAQIKAMGVKTSSFWDFIPNRDAKIPENAVRTIEEIAGDHETLLEIQDQQRFRRHRNHKMQRPATPLSELYFPDFIVKRDDEVLCDCGSADGDTIEEFLKRWPSYRWIYAFEPDAGNFNKLFAKYLNEPKNMTIRMAAVSDYEGEASFTSTGDYSAHLDPKGKTGINVTTLDSSFGCVIPTFIKFDIEGAELHALWGGKNIIQKHSPVLAVCAYHTADHLWQIPLLIHALNPKYKLYLRRYRPGSWEHLWYAVIPERKQL